MTPAGRHKIYQGYRRLVASRDGERVLTILAVWLFAALLVGLVLELPQ